MSDDSKLITQINRIRNKFKTEVDGPEDVQGTFLDEINSLIKSIFKDEPTDIYTIFTPSALEAWKKRKWRRLWNKFSIRKTLYFLLLLTITGFLVSESVAFYATEGSGNAKTWLKAILTEICFIFLSGYRSNGWKEKYTVGLLRVGMFLLMLFVITSNVVFKSTTMTSEISQIEQQIASVQEEIAEKNKTIEFYRNKGWGSSVNKHEKDKNNLSEQLRKLQNEALSGKTQEVSKVIEYQTYGRAFFRVWLLFISILITRRLFSF